jgi:hypothetical protein
VSTVRSISPGSVFKVAFVTYAVLVAIFGCFFILLPGLLGSSLLPGLMGENRQLAALGGGVAVTVVIYILAIFVTAFMQALFTAIGALFYNIIAGWVGGIRITLE